MVVLLLLVISRNHIVLWLIESSCHGVTHLMVSSVHGLLCSTSSDLVLLIHPFLTQTIVHCTKRRIEASCCSICCCTSTIVVRLPSWGSNILLLFAAISCSKAHPHGSRFSSIVVNITILITVFHESLLHLLKATYAITWIRLLQRLTRHGLEGCTISLSYTLVLLVLLSKM